MHRAGSPAWRVLLCEASFFSATDYRFHREGLEDACEDHGQVVICRGTIPDYPHGFSHPLATGKVFPVCGNSFCMLAHIRVAPHVSCIGDFSRHDGLFEGCDSSMLFRPIDPANAQQAAGSCC